MATQASAFPRLSPSGQRVVCGERVIVVDKTLDVSPGTSAQWADEDALYFTRQPDGAFMLRWHGGLEVVRAEEFNAFSIGGLGRWAGYSAAHGGVQFDNGTFAEGWSGPALSTDPAVWAALNHATGRIFTQAGTPQRYADRDCRDLRWCGRALVWNVMVDGRWQIAGMRDSGGPVSLLNVQREEFSPVPFLVGDALWLLTVTHTHLIVRPWGDTRGYVVASAPTHTPDAKALPDGRIRVVWDAGRDVLGDWIKDPRTEPRVDLSAIVPEEPVEDTSGEPIDPLLYMFGALPNRDGSHPMYWYVDSNRRRWYEVKFGNRDSWEAFAWTDMSISLFEDRSQSEPTFNPPWDYAFTADVWMRRPMRPGDRIEHDGNVLVRFDPRNNQIVNAPGMPFPYETRLGKVYTSYPFGGAVGTRPAIEVEMHVVGGPYFERHTYALGVGRVIWQAIDVRTGAQLHRTTFIEIGGPALVPTIGGRDSNTWPPQFQQVGMTITEPSADSFPRTADGNRFRCVCGTNPGEGWSQWVEWIYRKVGASTWTQQGERRNPRDDSDHTFDLPGPGDYEIGLRWESGQTGVRRVVRVEGVAPPPPPPPPRTTMHLTGHGGWIVRVDPITGLLSADRRAVDRDERLEVVRQGAAVALWAVFRQRFVRAVNGGGGALIADREVIEPHELFEVVPADGGVGLKTHTGHFWCAEAGGGREVVANRAALAAWETFFPSEPLGGSGGGTGGRRFVGQVRPDPRGGFQDDSGPVLVVGAHNGDGLSLHFRDPAAQRERDRITAEAGFDLRRAWFSLGGGYWKGHGSQPSWPQDGKDRSISPWRYQHFVEGISDFIASGASLGLGVHLAGGDFSRETIPDWRHLGHLVRQAIERAGAEHVLVGESLNEALFTDPDRLATPESLAEFADIAYGGLVGVIGLSALGGFDVEAQMVNGDILRRWNPRPANAIPFHGFRGFGWMNKLERDWNTSYEWHLGHAIDGEGMGIGRRVSAWDNMHELNASFFKIRTLLMLACGYISIHMSGPGVISDEGFEPYGSTPGFYEVAGMRDWLPRDAGHFRDVFHGGDGRPFSPRRFYRAIGDTRVEHFLHEDGRFLVIAYGNEAGHLPRHRNHTVTDDRWIEEEHIKGRLIVGHE